jgi:hypothetical protein
LTAGGTRGALALTAALGVCLVLAGCGSFAGAVTDAWPTWAGGEPKDVPPRPGAPGYEEFIAHQQQHQSASTTGAAAASVPGSTIAGAPGANAAAVPVRAAPSAAAPVTTAARPPFPPPANNANTQPPLPPAYARPDDRSATQGGLY